MSQWTLWFFLVLGLIVCGAAAWMRWKKGEIIVVPCVVAAAYACLLFSVYFSGFRYGTNVDDFCVINGHVVSATYEEEWTEEYTTTESYTVTDSKGQSHTKTRTVTKRRHHSPSWYADTTVGGMSLSPGQFAAFCDRFGNRVQTGSRHYGQVSWGDGRTFKTTWKGSMTTFIPATSTQNVINWVKGSRGTVYRAKGADTYQVLPYPGLVDTPHGPKQPRVLSSGVPIEKDWIKTVEWDMDVLADRVGSSKEANPLLYFTNQDQGFVEALKDRWIGGKKNDVIVVVGVKEWPKVDWVDVVAWSKNASFSVETQDALTMVDLSDREHLMRTLTSLIQTKFERNPMSSFEYLKFEIEIPHWIIWVSGILLVAAGLASALIPGEPRSSYPSRAHANFNSWRS